MPRPYARRIKTIRRKKCLPKKPNKAVRKIQKHRRGKTKMSTKPKTDKQCHNPWKEECVSENIKLYIQLEGTNLPICQECWIKIADSDKEWSQKIPAIQ
jgi:hypothetical protein